MAGLTAYRVQNYTGRIFSYTRVPVPGVEGQFALSHSFLRQTRLDVSIGRQGFVSGIFTPANSDILPQWQIRDLRDQSGRELYPNGIWVIENYEPVLNLYDQVDSFRAILRLDHTEEDDDVVL